MPDKNKPKTERTTQDEGIGVGEEGFEQDLGEDLPGSDVRQGQGGKQEQGQQGGSERQGQQGGSERQGQQGGVGGTERTTGGSKGGNREGQGL